MSKEASPDTTPVAPITDKVEIILSEKENKLLIAAMMSIKAGLPELDYTRFQKHGNFNTMKTAQNVWGTLKKKLREVNPEIEAAEKAEPKTPKGKATPKKRKAADEDGAAAEGDEESPKKKAKTPRKKKGKEVAAADGEEGAEKSPKKKAARKTPVKKAKKKGIVVAGEDAAEGEEKSEEKVKEESEKETSDTAEAEEKVKAEQAAAGDE